MDYSCRLPHGFETPAEYAQYCRHQGIEDPEVSSSNGENVPTPEFFGDLKRLSEYDVERMHLKKVLPLAKEAISRLVYLADPISQWITFAEVAYVFEKSTCEHHVTICELDNNPAKAKTFNASSKESAEKAYKIAFDKVFEIPRSILGSIASKSHDPESHAAELFSALEEAIPKDDAKRLTLKANEISRVVFLRHPLSTAFHIAEVAYKQNQGRSSEEPTHCVKILSCDDGRIFEASSWISAKKAYDNAFNQIANAPGIAWLNYYTFADVFKKNPDLKSESKSLKDLKAEANALTQLTSAIHNRLHGKEVDPNVDIKLTLISANGNPVKDAEPQTCQIL